MFNYQGRMKELCGDLAECKFPLGYFGNMRLWDYERVMENGEFKDSDIVLECGGLHSYFSIYAAQFVQRYICTDNFYWQGRGYSHPKTHQTNEEWCRYIESKGNGKIIGEGADIQKLQYGDGVFDKVVCISTLEHVIDDKVGLKEMMRVLKPGGLLLLTTEYNPNWSKSYSEVDGSYYRVYDKAGLQELLKDLTVENILYPEGLRKGEFGTLFVKVRK